MDYRIGIDLIDINRIKSAIEESGDVYLEYVYSDEEIKVGKKHPKPNHFFASAFAVKEATFKTFHTYWREEMDWRDIQVVHSEFGVPSVKLTGFIKKLAKDLGAEYFNTSISYENNYAIATVIGGFKKDS